MKFCKRCGSKIENEALFCSSCGLKIFGTEKQHPQETMFHSDTSLTKNVALFTICILMIFFSTIINNKDGVEEALGICAGWLSVSAVIAFFAIRPSTVHIDTEKMNLLKTIETFGVSVVYLIFSFFTTSLIGYLYIVFAFVFTLMTFLKIKKIDIMSRNTTEKVLLAFSIVLIILASFAFFGFFLSIFI